MEFFRIWALPLCWMLVLSCFYAGNWWLKVVVKNRQHLCYGTADPSRCPHYGWYLLQLTCLPCSAWRSAMVPTGLQLGRCWTRRWGGRLLKCVGFAKALTNIQQWLLGSHISHTVFDVIDFLCEIEDTISDGFRARHQLSYAHYFPMSSLKWLTIRSGHSPCTCRPRESESTGRHSHVTLVEEV